MAAKITKTNTDTQRYIDGLNYLYVGLVYKHILVGKLLDKEVDDKST